MAWDALNLHQGFRGKIAYNSLAHGNLVDLEVFRRTWALAFFQHTFMVLLHKPHNLLSLEAPFSLAGVACYPHNVT
ncbi:hypothetical protein Dimus_018638, partial [Dionaea muscipula]